VNLVYNSKLTTIANNVRTEGSGKAVGIGGFASPLELGKYTFQAITGAFGSIIGSLDITIASASPPGTSSAPSGLLEQPDKVTFSKYFKDMGLGKIPIGGQLPQDLQQNVAVFTSGDLIALYGTVIQGASLCSIL
jgi:hypothetical protein